MVTVMNPSIGSGYAVEKNFLRIGDTQFYVPPTSIKVHRQSRLEMQKMIRSKSSSPKESGYYEQIIEFSIIFPDLYAINNELRPILAQAKKFPFLPVENHYLNEILSIEAITISNITSQTVVGFPNCIAAVIQAYAFNPATYVYGEAGAYDELFNWKLFRWHYNRNLSADAKKNGRTYFEPITTDLENSFKFKIAAEDELQNIREWRLKKNDLIREWRKDKRDKPGFDGEDWDDLINNFFGSPDDEGGSFWNDEKDEAKFRKEYKKHMEEKINTYDISYDSMPVPGLVLLDMSVSMTNDIASQNTQMSPYSTHQFLGSSDVVASMRFLAQDEEAVNAFDSALNKAAYLTREYHKDMASGFLKFEHQLTRLFGIENVVVGDVSYNTIANQPGVHEINVVLYGYNRAEKRMHETQAMMSGSQISELWKIDNMDDARWPMLLGPLGGLYAAWNTPAMKNIRKGMHKIGTMDATMTMNEKEQAVYDAAVLESFKLVELYPDLELPMYAEVEQAGFSIPNLSNGIYVDPDFFFKYSNESYFQNILLGEMKKNFGLDITDAAGGGAVITSSDYSKAKTNDVTSKEVADINKELGVTTSSSVEKKDDAKVIAASPKNIETGIVEGWIREEADSNTFPQSFAVGFAKYFDKKLRHTYENGTNKDFGQVSVTGSSQVIEMNTASSYVAGEQKRGNYVGVMRVKYSSTEQITNIRSNIDVGVTNLSKIYKQKAYGMLTDSSYKNIDNAYKLFGVSKDAPSELQLVFASIIYMGGETALKDYLKGTTSKLSTTYVSMGKGILTEKRASGSKWSNQDIQSKIGDIKVSEYQTAEHKKDTSETPITLPDNFIHDTANDDTVRNAMLIDALKYDKRGRMVRAFPTFFLTFVDEGQYIGSVKMADQYFNYRAVRDIVYNNSRKQAAPTLMLELSNIFESLSDAEKAEDLSHQGLKDMWNYWMRPGAYAKEVQERTRNMGEEYYKSIYLKTGVRVHFRMGYGSNVAELPTLMNGPITSMRNNGHSISITCQGDGIEMTRRLSAWFSPDDETTGFLWAKQEPTHILDKLLTDDRGTLSNMKTMLSNSEYERHSMGLMHFGDPGNPIDVDKIGSSSIGGIGGAAAGFFLGGPAGAALGFAGGLIGGWVLGGQLNEVNREIRPINMNVHQTTGIANGSESLWNKVTDFLGIGQGDEDGVAYNLFDKTIWDVANINASIGSDMLAAVHPFGFRSTLFVGKGYFPLHYDYEVDLGAGSVTGTTVKTFRQVHSADSYTNIISNTIEATEENMYTTAVGTFMRNGELAATDTVYVDTNIWPEKQKNVTIDTTIDAKGFRMLKGLSGIPILGSITDAVNSVTGQKMFDEGVALRMTYAGLREHVKEMYNGYLTIMGNAAIKPYDYIALQDQYLNMGGTFEVREVTHMMNSDVGFITMIKPDVVVYNSDSKVGYFAMSASQVMAAAGSTLMLRALLSSMGFQGNMPIIQAMWAATKKVWDKTKKVMSPKVYYEKMKSLFNKRKTPNVAGSTGNTQEEVVSEDSEKRNKELSKPDLTDEEIKSYEKRGLLKKVAHFFEVDEASARAMLKSGASNMRTKYPKAIGKLPLSAQKTLGKTFNKSMMGAYKVGSLILKGGRLGRAGIQAIIGTTMVAAGNIVGAIAFAIEYAVVEIVCATVGELFNRWLTNRQCCVIIPLKKDGVRLLAGINGHKGSVAGDSPSTFESILGWASPVLGFFGVDASRYKDIPDEPNDFGVSAKGELRSTSLLREIKGAIPSLRSKDITDSTKKRSVAYLHRLDIAGVKARIEGNKSLLQKLASLVPFYDKIESIFEKIANSVGNAFKDALDRAKEFFGNLWDDIKDMFSGLIGGDDEDGGSCTSDMPTAKDYNGPTNGAHGQKNLKARIQGTDQWNDAIFKIAKKRGMNPVFVKVIMAIESAGNQKTISSAGAYGLMQVLKTTANKNKYDWNKMLTDAEYAINSGIDIIEGKISTAQRLKKTKNVFWVAQYYYGYKEGWSKTYGQQAEDMYKGLGYDPKTTDVTTQVVSGECSASEGSGSSETVSGVSTSKWPKAYNKTERMKHLKLTDTMKMSSSTHSHIQFPFGAVTIRKDAAKIASQVAKEYQEKFKEKMKINSTYRSGDTSSWHATGWAIDIDTEGTDYGRHMQNLKGGLRGYANKAGYEKAKFLADRFLHYGYDGIFFGDTRIRSELLKKYPGVSWSAYGISLGDHDGHLHVSCPVSSRVK